MLIVHLHLLVPDHDCHSVARIYKREFSALCYTVDKAFYENHNALSLAKPRR